MGRFKGGPIFGALVDEGFRKNSAGQVLKRECAKANLRHARTGARMDTKACRMFYNCVSIG